MLTEQQNIIKSFISSCKSNVCFLRVPEDDINSEFKKEFCVIDASKDFSPYKPFLTVLKDGNNGPDEKDIIEFSYSVQRDTFITYFRDGVAGRRYDHLLANELVYEQGRFIKTIIQLLKKSAKRNYLILNSQCLSKESTDVIRELEKSDIQSKFAFCFSSIKNDMEATAIFKMLDEYSTKPNYLFLVSDTVRISKDRTEYGCILEEDYEHQFNQLFNTLRNNRNFLCYEQLKEFASWVAENFGSFDLEEEEKRELSLELAKSLLQCNMADEAILYLNDIIDTQQSDECNAVALYYLSQAFSFKKTISLAQKYFTLAEKAFQEIKNEKYLALAAMLEFHIAKRTSAEDTLAKYKKALKLLEEQGLYNNFISVMISVPWRLVNDENIRILLDKEIDRCLELALKIDNQHLISTAYHWKGIIASHFGEIDLALKWYDKCNEIRTEIGEIGPILNIRNGLCYDAICRAMYKRAYDLENGIISELINISDFSSVTDTLKNVAYALFYSRHFSQAYEILNIISRYLTIFNMEGLANSSFLPSQNDILVFKSIISFDQCDFIRGRINHSNIMRDYDSVTKEDRPFIYLIEAVLSADEGDIKASELLFEKCISEFNLLKSKMAHKVVFSHYEYAVSLKNLGYKDIAQKYIKKGFEIARAEKFSYYTKSEDISASEVITVEQYVNGVEKFDKFNLNIGELNGKAEKEQLLTLLHKRIHDYQFINKVKTGNIKNQNIKRYVQTVLLDIQEYTLATEVFFGGKTDEGEFKIFQSISHDDSPSVDEEIFRKLMNSSRKRDNAQFVYNEEYNVYFGNISYASYCYGIVIKGSADNPITVDVLNTLNIALSSIQSQVVIFKQDEHLMIMSSTDQLSHLKNRHAFQECIAVESDKVRRYLSRKGHLIQVAVAFVDLDNFKYYNDNFGHNVGDLLIKSFASLLKETCRKIDFISRFGGDEFVIIMFDTNAAEGIRVYARLNECLARHEYFIPDIKILLNREDIEIPENRRIGFSMGISTNHDVEKGDDLEHVVQNADKALYYSKETCKGSVSVYEDIQDKIK